MASSTPNCMVQPFVCSTPLDFDAEREHLSAVVFPALADYAASLGGLFQPVDWNRQLASEHYASGRVLLLSLDCVRHCSPFFIGLLGETYGYHVQPPLPRTPLAASTVSPLPAVGDIDLGDSVDDNNRDDQGIGNSHNNDDGNNSRADRLLDVPTAAADSAFCVLENLRLAAEAGYAWLDWTQQHSSITELEILQGAFLEAASGNDDKASAALDEVGTGEYRRFYFRQPEHADYLYLNLPEAERVQKKAVFAAESNYAEYKIKDLKARIAKKGLPVRYFRSVQELGSLVFDDWRHIIHKLCPDLVTKSVCSIDQQLAREAIAHDLYARSLRQTFVKTSRIIHLFDELHRFSTFPAENTDRRDPKTSVNVSTVQETRPRPKSGVEEAAAESVFLLTGPRGSGKSAALANWLAESHNLHSGVKVIYHFTGTGAQHRDVATFMRRCIVELRAAYFPADEHACVTDDEVASFGSICDAFEAALGLGRCVLILDGVDELGSSFGKPALEVRRMSWLPARIPDTCKIILTMAASDLSYRYVRPRKDCTEHAMLPIARLDERMQVLHEHLARQRRDTREMALGSEHAERLVSHRLGGNPLYLLVVSSELCDVHVMSDIDSHVTAYAAESSASTVEARGLWGSVLRRWCRDYSWTKYSDSESSSHADTNEAGAGAYDLEVGGWVTDALRLVACARGGLREQEILGALEAMGYVGTARVKPFSWNLFFNAARCLFLLHPDGTISIAHQHFLDVFEYILMGSILPLSMDSISLNAGLGHTSELSSLNRSLAYHEALASYMVTMPWTSQGKRLMEVLWHLEKSSQWQMLCDHITNPLIFLKLYDVHSTHDVKEALRRYYNALCKQSFNPLRKCKAALVPQGTAALALSQSTSDVESQQSHREAVGRVGSASAKSASKGSVPVSPTAAALVRNSQTRRQRRHISFSAPLCIVHDVPSATYGRCKPGRLSERQNSRQRRSGGLSSDVLTTARSTMNSSDRVRFGMRLARLLLDLGDRLSAVEVLTGTHHIASQVSLQSITDGLLMVSVEELIGDVLVAMSDNQLNQPAIGTSAIQWFKKAYSSLLDVYHGKSSGNDAVPNENDVVDGVEGWKRRGLLLLKLGVEELKTGALDAADAHLLEARIHLKEALHRLGRMTATYYVGKLRLLQGHTDVARQLMQKALQYVERWYGQQQSLVATISHDLGILLSSSLSSDAHPWEASDAISYLQKALRIRRHICNGSLGLADTLFELGLLRQRSATKMAKKEALEFLSESLDIRIKKLGADHPLASVARQAAHELEVALHLGHYQFGSGQQDGNSEGQQQQYLHHSTLSPSAPQQQLGSTLPDADSRPALSQGGQQAAPLRWREPLHRPDLGRRGGSSSSSSNGRPSACRSAIGRRPQTAPSIIARGSRTAPELSRGQKKVGACLSPLLLKDQTTVSGAASSDMADPSALDSHDSTSWPSAKYSSACPDSDDGSSRVLESRRWHVPQPTPRTADDSEGADGDVDDDEDYCRDADAILGPQLAPGDAVLTARGASRWHMPRSQHHRACLLDEDTAKCLASTVTHGWASSLARLLDAPSSPGSAAAFGVAKRALDVTGHRAAWYHRQGHYAANPSHLPLVNKAINAWRRNRAKSAPRQTAGLLPVPVPDCEHEQQPVEYREREPMKQCLIIQKAV